MSRDGFIDVLQQAKSPAADVASECYDEFVAAGLDPAVGLAFFEHESTYGRSGAARSSHNWGNIRPTRTGWLERLGWHDGVYESTTTGRFLLFRDRDGEPDGSAWIRSARMWARLISELYVRDWHLSEVRSILVKYAPGRDRNNPGHYADVVEEAVASWAEEYPAEGEVTRLRREIAELEEQLKAKWQRLIGLVPSEARALTPSGDVRETATQPILWTGPGGRA